MTGPYPVANPLMLAPMAGVTDRPFRQLCRRFGADLTVSEMLTSDTTLWHTRKSRLRMDHTGEPEPRIVQIAGGDPEMLAQAAKLNAARGAAIIDINMGCPAKKVCRKWAGSALLADEGLVRDILRAVVDSVDIPVTLKYRTGPTPERRNAVRIAELAADAGIAALALHGRTRDQAYKGEAEYATIAAVKRAVALPVIANGDVDSPEKAARVLALTGADGLMVGRAAQGRPWLFGQIRQYLETGRYDPQPSDEQIIELLGAHVSALHAFYGAEQGLRVARKHMGWYLAQVPGTTILRDRLVRVTDAREQLELLNDHLQRNRITKAA